MGICSSSPAVKQQHLDAFGPKLGPLYDALYNEVLWIHTKWLEYRKLFAGTKARVELLNSSAGFFFYIVQDVMWEDVLLHVARLTDPAEKGSNKNLSLQCLPSAVPDPALAGEVQVLVDAAVQKAKFARKNRDKRLAHRDRKHALGTAATSISLGSRKNIEEALASFAAVLNRLHSEYLEGEVAFRDVVAGAGDANALVYHLATAAEAEDRRKKRMLEGTLQPDDFEWPVVP